MSYRWDFCSVPADDDALNEKTLNGGWEPFSVDNGTVYYRRLDHLICRCGKSCGPERQDPHNVWDGLAEVNRPCPGGEPEVVHIMPEPNRPLV